MSRSNEIDILPLAKQYANPNWIPGDWYLNQSPGYRFIFQILIGNLILAWGFLATSIVGRILCYCLIALGLVLIKRKLGLSLPLLLLVVFLFMTSQSFAAGELIISGLQPKVLSYGFVLLAVRAMLGRSYYWMALMLGLATSFHVLVGGWSFLILLVLLILRWNTCRMNFRCFGGIVLIYLIASSFSVKAVLEQLFSPNPESSIPTSYIYVFLRLPHHLNPLSWSSLWWIKLITYLVVLIITAILLRRIQQKSATNQKSIYESSEQYIARMRLFDFTIISLIPFILGIAVAPFDSNGSFLQYYPFRVGSVILPLNTYLLFACLLEQIFVEKKRQLLLFGSILLLSFLMTKPSITFKNQLLSLSQFPGAMQRVSLEEKSLSAWIRGNTSRDAIVISPPGSFDSFSWLTERPTIAKFRLFPQNKLGIFEWYQRMRDLSGNNPSILPVISKELKVKTKGFGLPKMLDSGYYSLTTAQVNFLMSKYQTDYFVTNVKHQLNLPIVYRNPQYLIYYKVKYSNPT
ncbi:DUF6798 domain-containing protein [Nostoc sp. WHI]|uniref:DUF6798 domain-containing protein n=1 Tax=Nostoc sp. WHI TaxID=2650611 RepID=UPI0018C6D3E3|nr:DUF6798 domain-containing protein [Nostoc sp. WHI]MBG1265209.1 hypothetical protein [Nostoc sp. WHI]MBG1270695.1 hypothetical protein [Nostoc sp. WHI]